MESIKYALLCIKRMPLTRDCRAVLKEVYLLHDCAQLHRKWWQKKDKWNTVQCEDYVIRRDYWDRMHNDAFIDVCYRLYGYRNKK